MAECIQPSEPDFVRSSLPKPTFDGAAIPQCLTNCSNELNYFAHAVGLGLRYADARGGRFESTWDIRSTGRFSCCRYRAGRNHINDVPARVARLQIRATATIPDFLQFGGRRSDAMESASRDDCGCAPCHRRQRAGGVPAKVVDRIVARVEEEIILQSDVEQLVRYQMLVDGKAESDAGILDRLIDQWIVRKEAEASRFPAASDVDVDRGMQRLMRSFAKPEDFEAQRTKAGLSEIEVRQIVVAQTYLSNYLDSRFRPTVQVEEQAIKDFYEQAVIPRAKREGKRLRRSKRPGCDSGSADSARNQRTS